MGGDDAAAAPAQRRCSRCSAARRGACPAPPLHRRGGVVRGRGEGRGAAQSQATLRQRCAADGVTMFTPWANQKDRRAGFTEITVR